MTPAMSGVSCSEGTACSGDDFGILGTSGGSVPSGHTLPTTLVPPFLLPAHLYTTFVMASQLIVNEFGQGRGLVLGSPPNMTYEAKYVLTDNQITALIKGLRAAIESRY